MPRPGRRARSAPPTTKGGVTITKLEEIYKDLRELQRSVENMDDAVVALQELIDESKRKMDALPWIGLTITQESDA